MQLTEVYELQKVAVAKIKVREIDLVKQAKKAKKVVDKIKIKMQETKYKEKTWEANKLRHYNVVNISCINFNDAGITSEMVTEAKVA